VSYELIMPFFPPQLRDPSISDPILLLMVILADATNLGLGKMGSARTFVQQADRMSI
jgi:hypothetical protein